MTAAERALAALRGYTHFKRVYYREVGGTFTSTRALDDPDTWMEEFAIKFGYDLVGVTYERR